jgi:hypothetical protein
MTKSRNTFQTEGRSTWWWILCAPGAALLWLQYMHPSSVRDTFGSARRKDVPLFQFLATMVVYGLVLFLITHLNVAKNAIWVLTLPFVAVFHLLFG